MSVIEVARFPAKKNKKQVGLLCIKNVAIFPAKNKKKKHELVI